MLEQFNAEYKLLVEMLADLEFMSIEEWKKKHKQNMILLEVGSTEYVRHHAKILREIYDV